MSTNKNDREAGLSSRRHFLASSGRALAVGVATSTLFESGARAEAGCSATLPVKWDESYDIVIIGTGFAGLAAAIEARRAGSSVLVIDKMRTYGGNSIINGGDMASVGNRFQKEAGIQDSAELLMNDMLKSGQHLNHPELARICAERSGETFDWCEQVVGAKFAKLVYHGGHSVKRSAETEGASGAGLVNPLYAKAGELGAKILLGTKLDHLLKNADGRVVGVEVRKHYRFPDEKTGQKAFIQAKKAVILASGGFAQNVELRMIHDPRVDARFGSTNHLGATGEATLEACRVGAMDMQMDWIQLGPWTSPDEKGFGNVPQFCEPLVGYGLMVDPATGKRFIMETGNRKVRADAIMALNHPVVIIADVANVQREVVSDVLERGMANGAIKKYDSVEAIAAAYGIPLDALKAQIALWNSYVAQKKDPDFGCKIFPDTTPTTTAPFYVARLWPRVHFCMGGLVIDKEARVHSFEMKTIPGLYAAGECAGGVHGAVRLGSCSMLSAVVFGRVAGENAARETSVA